MRNLVSVAAAMVMMVAGVPAQDAKPASAGKLAGSFTTPMGEIAWTAERAKE